MDSSEITASNSLLSQIMEYLSQLNSLALQGLQKLKNWCEQALLWLKNFAWKVLQTLKNFGGQLVLKIKNFGGQVELTLENIGGQIEVTLRNFRGRFANWFDKLFPPETRREKIKEWYQKEALLFIRLLLLEKNEERILEWVKLQLKQADIKDVSSLFKVWVSGLLFLLWKECSAGQETTYNSQSTHI